MFRFFIFYILFFLFFGCALQPEIVIEKKEKRVFHWVLVDVGSSGSRMYVMRIERGYEKNTRFPKISFLAKPKISLVSLSRLPAKAQVVGDYWRVFYDDLNEKMKKENVDIDGIYFFATGGFRSIAPEKAQFIISETQKFWQNNFIAPMNFKVINGEQEALWGWMAVYYLHDVLGQRELDSLRVIDMGGESFEVVLGVQTKHLPHRFIF